MLVPVLYCPCRLVRFGAVWCAVCAGGGFLWLWSVFLVRARCRSRLRRSWPASWPPLPARVGALPSAVPAVRMLWFALVPLRAALPSLCSLSPRALLAPGAPPLPAAPLPSSAPSPPRALVPVLWGLSLCPAPPAWLRRRPGARALGSRAPGPRSPWLRVSGFLWWLSGAPRALLSCPPGPLVPGRLSPCVAPRPGAGAPRRPPRACRVCDRWCCLVMRAPRRPPALRP